MNWENRTYAELFGKGFINLPTGCVTGLSAKFTQLFTVISGALYQILYPPPRSETTEEQMLRANKHRAPVIMGTSK